MNDCRKDNLTHFAVTVISKDRPGIVADISEVLYRLGCNLEDSSCTMLGGISPSSSSSPTRSPSPGRA
nr:ACT domain-containing protein [Geotalea toluenoxydans]